MFDRKHARLADPTAPHSPAASSPGRTTAVQARAAEPAPGAPPAVQRRATTEDALARSAPTELAARGVDGGGSELPFRSRIQAAFGHHDVSGIRAHQGDAARGAASALGAQAYAFGDAVAFASAPDVHTAAHEAAHVVQQRGGVQLTGGIDQRGDAYEQHADAVADAVVAGGSAAALLDQAPGQAGRGAGPAVQRQELPSEAAGGTATTPTTGDGTLAITAPVPGINQVGFIDTGDGANIRSGPAEAGGAPVWPEPLPPATRVFVSGTHPDAPDWHYASAYVGSSMVRGYIQGLRINTQLPEPTAELYQVVAGDTVEGLAQRKFGGAVRDGHDLRYYENVLLYVNQQQGRVGITGAYQRPDATGGGSNNIQLVADHRIWLVSPEYAQALEQVVPSGSFSGGAVAGLDRFAGHVQDVMRSVDEAPNHLLEVAGQYAQAITEHLPEILGVVALFLSAEALTVELAATPTGITQIVAGVIQLVLAWLGAQAMVQASVEAAQHGATWLTTAWHADGDDAAIADASRELIRMLVSLAVAALSMIGMNNNLGNAARLADAVATPSLVPAYAIAGAGSQGGAGAVAGVTIAAGQGGAGPAMAMATDNQTNPSRGGGGPSEETVGKVTRAEAGLDPSDGLCDIRAARIAERLHADGIDDVLRIQLTPESEGFVRITHATHVEQAPYHVVAGLEIDGVNYVIDPTTHAGLLRLGDYLSQFIENGTIAGAVEIAPGRVMPGGITHY